MIYTKDIVTTKDLNNRYHGTKGVVTGYIVQNGAPAHIKVHWEDGTDNYWLETELELYDTAKNYYQSNPWGVAVPTLPSQNGNLSQKAGSSQNGTVSNQGVYHTETYGSDAFQNGTSQNEMSKSYSVNQNDKNVACAHSMVKYEGLTESYSFCTKCDHKEK